MKDRYLQKLWRDAVLKKDNYRCVMCGIGGEHNLQCHHFIKRRVRVLRHDYRNGFALCYGCHAKAHTKAGEQRLIKIMGIQTFEYLTKKEVINLKDHIRIVGISREKFYLNMGKELKEYISNKDID